MDAAHGAKADHAAKLRSIAKFDDQYPWSYLDLLAAADEIERLQRQISDHAAARRET